MCDNIAHVKELCCKNLYWCILSSFYSRELIVEEVAGLDMYWESNVVRARRYGLFDFQRQSLRHWTKVVYSEKTVVGWWSSELEALMEVKIPTLESLNGYAC